MQKIYIFYTIVAKIYKDDNSKIRENVVTNIALKVPMKRKLSLSFSKENLK